MTRSRRAFLQSAVLTTAAALCSRPQCSAAPASTTPLPAIDTHTHFYDPTRKQGVPWPPATETVLYKPHYPRAFQRLTQPLHVVGTVVVEASPWVEDNQWILDLAKQNSFIVGFIGHLELGKPEFAANLNRFGANPLFRGLRVSLRALANGLGQTAFEHDLLRLGERKYALDVLGEAALLPNVVRAAKLAPGLRIVIDHLPFAEWDQDVMAMQRALADVAQAPNVYAKVSNVARRVKEHVVETPEFYRPALDSLWKLFGADRLIFGSNWPVSNRVAPSAWRSSQVFRADEANIDIMSSRSMAGRHGHSQDEVINALLPQDAPGCRTHTAVAAFCRTAGGRLATVARPAPRWRVS